MSPRSGPPGSKVLATLGAWEAAGDHDAVAGFFEDAKYPDGESVPQVMYYAEHGTVSKDGSEHSPPRPVMRRTSKNNHSKWMKVLHRHIDSGMDVKTAYGQVAAMMAGDIKKSINSFSAPGNAPSTIKAKGFDSPLRETKVALRAVSHQVRKRASGKGKK